MNNKKKNKIDVEDVFCSQTYEEKAEKQSKDNLEMQNINSVEFEEKKENLENIINKTGEEYKKNKHIREEELNNSYVCNGEICKGVEYTEEDFKEKLMPEAIKFIAKHQQASISMLQRRFSIGFVRAARIIDILEDVKLISPSDIENPKPREVYFNESDVEQILKEAKYKQTKI